MASQLKLILMPYSTNKVRKKYSNTCVNDHLRSMSTFKQQVPVNNDQSKSPTQLKNKNFAPTFDHILNNEHFFGVPRVVIVLRFYIITCIYSQTWANSHLWIMTTCPQRPPFERPNLNFCKIRYLWTRTTCQHRPRFLGPKGGRCTQAWLYYLYSNNNLPLEIWNEQKKILVHFLSMWRIMRKKY
jgi:hypothetical protein